MNDSFHAFCQYAPFLSFVPNLFFTVLYSHRIHRYIVVVVVVYLVTKPLICVKSNNKKFNDRVIPTHYQHYTYKSFVYCFLLLYDARHLFFNDKGCFCFFCVFWSLSFFQHFWTCSNGDIYFCLLEIRFIDDLCFVLTVIYSLRTIILCIIMCENKADCIAYNTIVISMLELYQQNNMCNNSRRYYHLT